MGETFSFITGASALGIGAEAVREGAGSIGQSTDSLSEDSIFASRFSRQSESVGADRSAFASTCEGRATVTNSRLVRRSGNLVARSSSGGGASGSLFFHELSLGVGHLAEDIAELATLGGITRDSVDGAHHSSHSR